MGVRRVFDEWRSWSPGGRRGGDWGALHDPPVSALLCLLQIVLGKYIDVTVQCSAEHSSVPAGIVQTLQVLGKELETASQQPDVVVNQAMNAPAGAGLGTATIGSRLTGAQQKKARTIYTRLVQQAATRGHEKFVKHVGKAIPFLQRRARFDPRNKPEVSSDGRYPKEFFGCLPEEAGISIITQYVMYIDDWATTPWGSLFADELKVRAPGPGRHRCSSACSIFQHGPPPPPPHLELPHSPPRLADRSKPADCRAVLGGQGEGVARARQGGLVVVRVSHVVHLGGARVCGHATDGRPATAQHEGRQLQGGAGVSCQQAVAGELARGILEQVGVGCGFPRLGWRMGWC